MLFYWLAYYVDLFVAYSYGDFNWASLQRSGQIPACVCCRFGYNIYTMQAG